MRKKYHTLEEMRKALAERQARWRERNRGYERIRAKNNYAKRRMGSDVGSAEDVCGAAGDAEGKEFDREGDTGGERADSETRELDGVKGMGIGCAGSVEGGKGVQETIVEPIEGWDTPSAEYAGRMKAYKGRRSKALMEPEHRGGHGNNKDVGEAHERGIGASSIGGQEETAEERRVRARLEEFATRGRRRGVQVELKF